MKRRAMVRLGGATLAAAALPRFAIGQSTAATTLKFIPQDNLTSLDPIWTTASVTANHAYAVYDTSYAVNGKLEPKPQMAEGHTMSDDGRVYLIMLREGLKFHDGEPVRAQDCAQSLERWAARDTMGQTLATFVDSCGVQDDRTIKITLKSPFPVLIDALAKPEENEPFIMPERVARTDPMQQIKETIGSGPFRFLRTNSCLAAMQPTQSSMTICRGRSCRTGRPVARLPTSSASNGTSFRTPPQHRQRCNRTRWTGESGWNPTRCRC
jgi:peptide/nickel transport system substrate-binding protein